LLRRTALGETTMKNVTLFCAVVCALASVTGACASSMQPPVDRLASTDAAIRSARELGAQSDPQAALHLKLADDQVAQARHLMRDGENRRATLILERAKSDAELAVMMTKERAAKSEATKAHEALGTGAGK
jgi:hypothetical protein